MQSLLNKYNIAYKNSSSIIAKLYNKFDYVKYVIKNNKLEESYDIYDEIIDNDDLIYELSNDGDLNVFINANNLKNINNKFFDVVMINNNDFDDLLFYNNLIIYLHINDIGFFKDNLIMNDFIKNNYIDHLQINHKHFLLTVANNINNLECFDCNLHHFNMINFNNLKLILFHVKIVSSNKLTYLNKHYCNILQITFSPNPNNYIQNSTLFLKNTKQFIDNLTKTHIRINIQLFLHYKFTLNKNIESIELIVDENEFLKNGQIINIIKNYENKKFKITIVSMLDILDIIEDLKLFELIIKSLCSYDNIMEIHLKLWNIDNNRLSYYDELLLNYNKVTIYIVNKFTKYDSLYDILYKFNKYAKILNMN